MQSCQEISPFDTNLTLKCQCEFCNLQNSDSPNSQRKRSKCYIFCDLCCEKKFNMLKSSVPNINESVFE